MFQQHNIHLLFLGVDNVLVPAFDQILSEEARQFLGWLSRQPGRPEALVLISNQGGVGLRYWMELKGWGQPDHYPTQEQADERLAEIARQVMNYSGIEPLAVKCYRYYTPKSDQWSPLPFGIDPELEPEWSQAWRLPGRGMLIHASQITSIGLDQALYIGANREEEIACRRAGVRYLASELAFIELPESQDWSELVQEGPQGPKEERGYRHNPDMGLTEEEISF